jgi:hypothetical protein
VTADHIGGYRTTAAAIDHHVARPTFLSVSEPAKYGSGWVDLVIGGDSLRAGCDRDHAAASFFAMVNSHCYKLLAGHLG